LTNVRLIVGLGNPGKAYQNTRHNIGFAIGAHLVKHLGSSFKSSPIVQGHIAQAQLDSHEVYVLLPSTFMNHSGIAVKKMIERHQIPLSHVLVICDDLNLEFGQMRLRARGSAGGHNGLISIIAHLKSDHFARLRVGIGRPTHKDQVSDYVLEKFTKVEEKNLDPIVSQASECAEIWIKEGINKAMDYTNKRKVNGNS